MAKISSKKLLAWAGVQDKRNDCRQKPAFAAWLSRTDARCQYSHLVLIIIYLHAVYFYCTVELFYSNRAKPAGSTYPKRTFTY